MKKSTKQLIILLIVLVVCAAALVAVYMYNSSQSAKEAEAEEASVIHLGNLEDVAQITYFNGTETLSFTYSDSAWVYTDNPEFPLDGTNLDTIKAAITNMTAVREVAVSESLDSYGITDTSPSFKATDSNGNTLELVIGKAAGDYYYAMVPGGDTIYTISSDVVPCLSKTLAEMMTLETITNANASELDSITLSASGQQDILFEKESVDKQEMVQTTDSSGADREELQTVSESYWYMKIGDQERSYMGELQVVESSAANMTPIDYLGNIIVATSNIKNNSCAAYHATDADLEQFGLSEPTLKANVNYTKTDDDGNATQSSYTLIIGAKNDDVKATDSDNNSYSCYYAMMEGSSTVYLISAQFIQPFIDGYNGILSSQTAG